MLRNILILTLLFSACGTSPELEFSAGELERLPHPTEPPILIVIPPEAPSIWSSEDTFKRTHQIVDALHQRQWLLFAPWELDFPRLDPTRDVLQRSNALLATSQLDISSKRLYTLRISFREGSSSESVIRSSDERDTRFRSYRRTINLQLELRDPDIDKRVLLLETRIHQDPLDEEADVVDELPAFTEALPGILDAFTDAAADLDFGPGDVPPAEGDFRINPVRVELFAVEAQTPLRQRLSSFDDIEQLARKVIHYQFFVPDLEADDIRRFLDMPAGTEVLEPGALAAWGVIPGDILLEYGGVPLEGRHAVTRTLHITGDEPSQTLRIQRGGAPMILVGEAP